MKLSQCLPWRRRADERPAPPSPVDAGDEPTPEQLDDVLLGCGWFDSSHELTAGLQVTEHLTPERVANELPLGWWLVWQAQRAAPAAPAALGLR